MDAETTTDVALPSVPPRGQRAFCDVNDDLWVRFVLGRLAAGDSVIIERDGSFVFFDAGS